MSEDPMAEYSARMHRQIEAAWKQVVHSPSEPKAPSIKNQLYPLLPSPSQSPMKGFKS